MFLNTTKMIKKLCLYSVFLFTYTVFSQVGIGTTTPDPAAVLDINSQIETGRYGGLKLPTVTLAQRAQITTPVPDGLMLYVVDATSRCVQVYDANIADWINVYCMNKIPVASAVDYTGVLEVGETLTSSYTYNDAEGNTEAGTTFKWYRATDAAGTGATAIAGADAATYITTITDGGAFIAVGVTPQAATGASPGAEVYSDYKQILFKQTIVAFDIATTAVNEAAMSTITINLTNPNPNLATTVEVNINAGSSTIGALGTDYNIDNGGSNISSFPFTVAIPAGAATASFDFNSLADNDNAIDEVLVIDLQNPSGGTNAILGTTIAHTITVNDDDTPTSVAFTAISSTVNEPTATGNDSTIAVAIADPSSNIATSVEVSLDASSTVDSGDYSVVYDGNAVTFPFTITFAAGQTANESFTITAIDDADTDDETLVLNLVSPTGGVANATIGTDATHTMTIVDDDGPLLLAIQDFEVAPATPTLNYVENSAGFLSTGTGTSPNTANYIGARGYGVQNSTADIDFGPVNTTAYTSATLKFRLASFSVNSGGNGADSSDTVEVYISDDSGATFSYELEITGVSNSRYDFSSTGSYSLIYDGDDAETSVSSSSTTAYSTIEITGLPATANLVVGIVMSNNSNNELWVIDNVEIYGNL
jgi:hypothetical protein